MVLLMATLFWALMDEDFGQRPWEDLSAPVEDRYSTYLKTARSQFERLAKGRSRAAPDYQKLKQDYETASPERRPAPLRRST